MTSNLVYVGYIDAPEFEIVGVSAIKSDVEAAVYQKIVGLGYLPENYGVVEAPMMSRNIQTISYPPSVRGQAIIDVFDKTESDLKKALRARGAIKEEAKPAEEIRVQRMINTKDPDTVYEIPIYISDGSIAWGLLPEEKREEIKKAELVSAPISLSDIPIVEDPTMEPGEVKVVVSPVAKGFPANYPTQHETRKKE